MKAGIGEKAWPFFTLDPVSYRWSLHSAESAEVTESL